MGNRFEKVRKEVQDTRECGERIKSDRLTLKEEYSILDTLDANMEEYEDEIARAIYEVKSVGEQESNRLETEYEENERQKDDIVNEIDGEIDKLQNSIDLLEKAKENPFGRNSVEQAKNVYKEQKENYEDLISDLGKDSDASKSAGGIAGSSEIGNVNSEKISGNDYENQNNANRVSIVGILVNSVMNSHDPDVKKWTSYLDSFTKTIKNQYSDKYGQYITPGKLDVPLSETLVYETKALFESKGLPGGVLGYNDGVKSRVAVGTGFELQTTVHENLHQLSANGNSHGIIEYDNGIEKNVQVNEAITEMLTQRTLGNQYGADYSAYSENRDAMKLLESAMGEDTVCRAYFQNNPELLRNEFDSTLGLGTWDQLAEAFDDSLSDIEHTRESGRIRRDDLINRYLVASEKKSGGGNNWMEMLS